MDYLTNEEHTNLKEELESLIRRRSEISDRIGRARELGDLKENADYHAAKDDQGHNERKIKDLETRLAEVVVADTTHVPDDMVFLGAVVRLKNLKTEKEDLTSVSVIRPKFKSMKDLHFFSSLKNVHFLIF